MSDYKALKGFKIKAVSSDPSNLITGDIWYNTTTRNIKVAPQIGAWASGGDLNTARSYVAGGGTQTAGLAVVGYSGGVSNTT